MTKLLTALVIVLVVVIPTLTSTFYTVREDEQVIITEFGRAVGKPITDAGLHIKKPFIQTVLRFSKRILEWNGLRRSLRSTLVYHRTELMNRHRSVDGLFRDR